ncbi:MAG: hypothetical protein COA45_06605 [Zetaproteobacteria bacterium]|nr:MAG: hypothetical protein COA45_06605 [Zetaproteobacteria bacterium]
MKSHKKFSGYYVGFVLVMLCVSGFSNSASSTTVIEFFGRNSCSADVIVQDSLKNILQSEEDVIIINCRTWFDKEASAKTFSHKFCNDRDDFYTKKFRATNMFYTSPLVVNGRWDAFYKDIMPAVKMGQSDKIEPIVLKVHDDMLDITIPEMSSTVGSGDIMLYAYMPSQGGTASLYVDPDVSLTDEMKERIGANQSVPFVTKRSMDPYYIRPVLSMAKIGHWNGTQISMTVSLDEVSTMAASAAQDLSYIVVLYEGGEIGPILAVGEVVSEKEFNNTLPNSTPMEIKFLSAPKL